MVEQLAQLWGEYTISFWQDDNILPVIHIFRNQRKMIEKEKPNLELSEKKVNFSHKKMNFN